MQFVGTDRFEDWAADVCLYQFWWERNQVWAVRAGRREAESLGWYCPVHGVAKPNPDGGFSCPVQRPTGQPARQRQQPQGIRQATLVLGDVA